VADVGKYRLHRTNAQAIKLTSLGVVVRKVQELLGHSDVTPTMIYTHVLKVAAGCTASLLDALAA
jgi:site-specific recombinase XerD